MVLYRWHACRLVPASMGLLLTFLGCDSTNGFRFDAVYAAPGSGFRIAILSRGYIKSGDDLADKSFARVRVCPTVPGRGGEFQFALTRLPV